MRENILNLRRMSEDGKWTPGRTALKACCRNLIATCGKSSVHTEGMVPRPNFLPIPQEWYPHYKPKYETPGWWYVPIEEILGRVCKKCNAFSELADFTKKGTDWDSKNKASCRKCKPEHDRAGRQSGSKKLKISEGEGKMITKELAGSTHQRPVKRTARWQPAVKYDIDMKSDGSSDSEESSDDARPSLGVRMRRECCLLVLNSVTCTPQRIRQPEAAWLCVWCLCVWCLCVRMCSDILGSLSL